MGELNIQEIVDRIPAPAAGSDEGYIFRAYRLGEINFQDWINHEAIRSVEREGDQCPKPYPEMPAAARAYVDGRLAGKLPYDKPAAKRLGDWFYAITQLHEYNSERLAHFLWCAEKCQAVGLLEHVGRANRAAMRFRSVSLPYQDIQMTMLVKQKDSIERSEP